MHQRAEQPVAAGDACRFKQGITGMLSKTDDARKAQQAFIEKRKPVFKGRWRCRLPMASACGRRAVVSLQMYVSVTAMV
jgi:hypothetical protein